VIIEDAPQQPRDLIVERERLARLLAAESARVGELTEQLNDAILYEREARDAMASATRASALIRCGVSMERVALTIAERDARTIAALESERDALAAKLAEVRALHCEADNDYRRTPSCETCHGKAGVHECGCWSSEDRQMVCGHCNGDGRFESVPYPCPTVAILDRDGGECSGSAKVGELDAMLAKLLDLAAWHETKAMKARQYPGVGSEDVMAKAAQVHDDASRRLLAILDRDGGE